uniref:nucleolar protein 12 n=1 Tax=Ciona intestinalis TaxID=7719 RepID=UPI000180CB83|nr:nucleolar protein 12 [Ciona intestinalis]|eukprot:XP_002131835.1 nucleolar protein 12 [Ciona intestinalis]
MGKPRARKLDIKFDEEKRKDFLTGFHKRKEARKKQARLQLDKQIKEERIKIRKNKRDGIQNRLEEMNEIRLGEADIGASYVDINSKVLEMPNHNVTVVESELFDSVTDMFMGSNEPAPEVDPNEVIKKEKETKRAIEHAAKLTSTQQRLKQNKKKLPTGKLTKRTKKFHQRKHRHNMNHKKKK